MAERVIDTLVTELMYRMNEASLRRAEARIASVRRGLTSASNAMLPFGIAAAAAVGIVAKTTIGVDAAMKNLEARTGANTEQLKRFKEQAYEVGSALPLDTEEIIKAQAEFKALGFTIEETFDAIPAIAQYAVAALGGDIELAASHSAIALNNFNIEAKGLGTVLDQLLKAETETAGRARNIGNAFAFSAQQAAVAGLSTADYISLLGSVAGAGREVESVSQGIGLFISNINKGLSGTGRGSKMVVEAFESIGISMNEVRGSMKDGEHSLESLFTLMQERTAGKPTEFLEAALSQLSGTSYASSIGYAVRNVEKLRSVREAVEDSVGEMARYTEIIMSGLSGAYIDMGAQWDTLKNRLGDVALNEDLERTMRGLADFMAELTRTDDEGKLVHETFLKLAGALLKLGLFLIPLSLGLRAMSFLLAPFELFFKFIPQFSAAGRAIGRFGAAAWAALPGLRLLFGVLKAAGLAAFANPYVLIGAAIALLILGLWALWRNWDQVSEWLKSSWLGGLFLGTETLTTSVFDPLMGWLRALWDLWAQTSDLLTGSWLGLLLLGIIFFINPFVGVALALTAFRDEWAAVNDYLSNSWLGKVLTGVTALTNPLAAQRLITGGTIFDRPDEGEDEGEDEPGWLADFGERWRAAWVVGPGGPSPALEGAPGTPGYPGAPGTPGYPGAPGIFPLEEVRSLLAPAGGGAAEAPGATPAQPVPVILSPGGGVTNRTKTTNVNIDRIEVNAEGGDPGRIAAEIKGGLLEEMEDLVDNTSSPVVD